MSTTYREMVSRLAGRYGLAVVRARELRGEPASEDDWKAIYNLAVGWTDYDHWADAS